jgi:hypothetical protein
MRKRTKTGAPAATPTGDKAATRQNEEKKNSSQLETEKEAAEEPFDFGGLPVRDLKKNLGCG